MKAKLPPMRPRVVVAEHVTEPARRARVFECLATLGFTGFLEEVRAHVRLAQGALVQLGSVLPASTKDAAAFGLRVLGALEYSVMGAGMWLAMREAGSDGLLSMEGVQLRQLQGLMDLVYEAESAFDHDARIAVAGLGGGGAWWSNGSLVTSGFDEAVNLADDVRLVVLGVVENPFARFLPQAKGTVREWRAMPGSKRRVDLSGSVQVLTTKKPEGATWLSAVPAGSDRQQPLRPQVNREKPERPADTDERDVAILRAMRAGHAGKAVAPATGRFGAPSLQSHVDKRRQDFVKWGWVTRGRDSKLTPAGERWLAEIPVEEPRQPPARR